MEQPFVIHSSAFQDFFQPLQTVDADFYISALVKTADITDACVPFVIHKVLHHHFLPARKINLHLIVLIGALVGIHQHDRLREREQKRNFFFFKQSEGNNSIDLLRLPEGEPHKRYLIFVCHKLEHTRQSGRTICQSATPITSCFLTFASLR